VCEASEKIFARASLVSTENFSASLVFRWRFFADLRVFAFSLFTTFSSFILIKLNEITKSFAASVAKQTILIKSFAASLFNFESDLRVNVFHFLQRFTYLSAEPARWILRYSSAHRILLVAQKNKSFCWPRKENKSLSAYCFSFHFEETGSAPAFFFVVGANA